VEGDNTPVQFILSGRKYITPTLTEQLAAQLENPLDKAPHQLLSDRVYKTLLLFAQGKTVSQIAKELSPGFPAVSTCCVRILGKMGMKTNAELASYVIHNNIV
jgi:DNA-binding NarL/FixJ family response regulator